MLFLHPFLALPLLASPPGRGKDEDAGSEANLFYLACVVYLMLAKFVLVHVPLLDVHLVPTVPHSS